MHVAIADFLPSLYCHVTFDAHEIGFFQLLRLFWLAKDIRSRLAGTANWNRNCAKGDAEVTQLLTSTE